MKYVLLSFLLVGCGMDGPSQYQIDKTAYMDSCQKDHKLYECMTLFEHRHDEQCQTQSNGSGLGSAVGAGVAAGVTGAVVHHLLK
jgi:hypothetical protein